MPLAAQMEAGHVKVLKGPWNEPFFDEAEAFPNGTHKDQVDAVAGAFNELALELAKPANPRRREAYPGLRLT